MLLWFVGTAWLAVWFVFRDERFDYRLLAAGALLPDVVDIVTGGAWVMHSITASVVVLTAVMLATRGRRETRRHALAVPIGMFLHLVFDGAFARTVVFWWPFGGLSFGDEPLPSLDRWALNPVLELLGLAALWWMWRAHGLGDAAARRRLWSTGQLHATRPAGGAGTC